MVFYLEFDKAVERPIAIKLKQFDRDTQIRAKFFENGEQLDLKDYIGIFECTKPDSNFVIQENTIVQENMLIVNLIDQVTPVSGRVNCQFVLKHKNRQEYRDTTFTFFIDVRKDVIEGASNSESVITATERLQQEVQVAVENLQQGIQSANNVLAELQSIPNVNIEAWNSHMTKQATSTTSAHVKLVDNLTTSIEGVALSAKQGSVLNNKITDLIGELTTASLGGSGYVKLKNGLIIQWGVGQANMFSSGGTYIAETNVLFPIAFPNKRVCAIGSPGNMYATFNAAYSYSGDSEIGASFKFDSRTGANMSFNWIAIGY